MSIEPVKVRFHPPPKGKWNTDTQSMTVSPLRRKEAQTLTAAMLLNMHHQLESSDLAGIHMQLQDAFLGEDRSKVRARFAIDSDSVEDEAGVSMSTPNWLVDEALPIAFLTRIATRCNTPEGLRENFGRGLTLDIEQLDSTLLNRYLETVYGLYALATNISLSAALPGFHQEHTVQMYRILSDAKVGRKSPGKGIKSEDSNYQNWLRLLGQSGGLTFGQLKQAADIAATKGLNIASPIGMGRMYEDISGRDGNGLGFHAIGSTLLARIAGQAQSDKTPTLNLKLGGCYGRDGDAGDAIVPMPDNESTAPVRAVELTFMGDLAAGERPKATWLQRVQALEQKVKKDHTLTTRHIHPPSNEKTTEKADAYIKEIRDLLLENPEAAAKRYTRRNLRKIWKKFTEKPSEASKYGMALIAAIDSVAVDIVQFQYNNMPQDYDRIGFEGIPSFGRTIIGMRYDDVNAHWKECHDAFWEAFLTDRKGQLLNWHTQGEKSDVELPRLKQNLRQYVKIDPNEFFLHFAEYWEQEETGASGHQSASEILREAVIDAHSHLKLEDKAELERIVGEFGLEFEFKTGSA